MSGKQELNAVLAKSENSQNNKSVNINFISIITSIKFPPTLASIILPFNVLVEAETYDL